ncbi:transglycosylase SLT domain-containing protein [Kosmotoga pacifica]|uniref:Transglycosylase SLT domain-containing protein n=1 Tax=Kosmotoga pacifica TaxID=1330330 RepID=A0A0G2Z5R8_9BACT|nr:transglycosylase SLT domain-containing protein [Kosmotoga pacifica]AKI96912.1 hypothetical protein IX53_02710 [Kosmotoga pacifica]
MNKNNSDILTFTLFLVLILAISITIVFFNPHTPSKIVKELAILYNKGLNIDISEYFNEPSYSYPEDVLNAYRFFKGKKLSNFHGFAVTRTASNVSVDIFESGDRSIETLINHSVKKKKPFLKERIREAIGLSSTVQPVISNSEKIINAVYNALLDFSTIEVPLRVGDDKVLLSLSDIEPELVLAICFKESGFNPLALGKVTEENPEFRYSRGLMQIYQKTLYTLNTWLAETGINISPEELWNIRNNIFLGMVYLAYAREQLLKGD